LILPERLSILDQSDWRKPMAVCTWTLLPSSAPSQLPWRLPFSGPLRALFLLFPGARCRSPRPAYTPANPLHAFTGWHLDAHCPQCRVIKQVRMADLIAREGAEENLGDVVFRLRCQTCGTAPTSVELADGYPGMAKPVRKAMLVGPASR